MSDWLREALDQYRAETSASRGVVGGPEVQGADQPQVVDLAPGVRGRPLAREVDVDDLIRAAHTGERGPWIIGGP